LGRYGGNVELVKRWDQVIANIRKLEEARTSRDVQLRKAYVLLIKRGTCFVQYHRGAGLAFAPSKFIGYVDNNILSHLQFRSDRDGRDTNRAIAEILERVPEVDQAAEAMYREFCRSLNFEPNKAGTFGVPRKFWVTDEVVNLTEAAAVAAIRNDSNLTQTEKDQLVKARLGQGQFRKDLISLWGRCCLTGCTTLKLLRASHIKPWKESDNRERLDRFNGLLLTPNADALFEQGYITFSANGDLIISARLSSHDAQVLLAGCGKRIKVHEASKSYLEYHRKNRFRGGAA
jgi:putative restriction endonuclease